MTSLEWYGLVAPFILLAFGLIVFFYAQWEADRSDRRIAAMDRQKHKAAE